MYLILKVRKTSRKLVELSRVPPSSTAESGFERDSALKFMTTPRGDSFTMYEAKN